MKKLLALLLILVMILASVVSASAFTVLEPREQIKYNFKNFYSEKTDGEIPCYVECYELKDYPVYDDVDNYDYYLVTFISDEEKEATYFNRFGENDEFYEQFWYDNKVFKSGLAVFVGFVYDDEYKNSFYSLEEIAKDNPAAIKCIEEMMGSNRVGVINGDECYKPQVDKLDSLCWKSTYTFGIGAGNYIHEPGYVFLYINEDNLIRTAVNEAVELIEKTNYHYLVFSSNGVTQQEVEDAYNKLQSAMKSATVKKYEVEFLLDFCQHENNNDGYYPDELWLSFTESLANARAVLDKENAKNDEYNEAYWDMLYSYNMLCSANPIMYDVNFDGEINVLDATQYQKVLAGLVSSNSSISYITNFDYTCATRIQRRLVGLDLDKPLYGENELKELVNSREMFNLQSDKWDFGAWKINECYYNSRVAGRC